MIGLLKKNQSKEIQQPQNNYSDFTYRILSKRLESKLEEVIGEQFEFQKGIRAAIGLMRIVLEMAL